MAGYVTRGKRGLDVLWEWTGFLLSYGGRYFDDQGKPAFNSPEGIAATEMFVKLLNDAGPEGTMNWSWMEAQQNFAQGKSAMYVEAGGIGPVLEKKDNPASGKVGYVGLPHPEGKTAIPDYWFWMIGIRRAASRRTAPTCSSSGLPARLLARPGAGRQLAGPCLDLELERNEHLGQPRVGEGIPRTLKLVQPKLVPYDRADFPEITDAISAEINNIQPARRCQAALNDAAAKWRRSSNKH